LNVGSDYNHCSPFCFSKYLFSDINDNLHNATTAGGQGLREATQAEGSLFSFPDNLHDPTNRQGLREATQAEGSPF
jgi:hypothetical protein